MKKPEGNLIMDNIYINSSLNGNTLHGNIKLFPENISY